MSLQICPKCNRESFTWGIIDESGLTHWYCNNRDCKYHAVEDESLERVCRKCGHKSESNMKDDFKNYWWCSYCDKVTAII